MSRWILTETSSLTSLNSGRERHGCLRSSAAWIDSVDSEVKDVFVSPSPMGESSRDTFVELSELLSVLGAMLKFGKGLVV